MDDLNVVYGSNPTVSVFNGTAGEEIYDALVKYKALPKAMICAQTKEIVSYRKILETSCRLSRALQVCGYSQNSVVAIFSENCLGYLYPVIASWYLGIIVTTINPEFLKYELDRAISLSKPEVIFCSTKTLQKARELREKVHYIRKVIVIDEEEEIDGVESLKSFIHRNCDKFFNIKQFKPVHFDINEQIALIVGSSGTTGLSKGVMVTHKNLIYRFATSRESEFMLIEKPASNVLSFEPRYHAFGLLATVEDLLMGYCSVLIKKFDQRLFLQSIQEYKIKRLVVFPRLAVFLAKSSMCEEYDLSSVEYVETGGAPISIETEEHLLCRFGEKVHIGQGYGLTETNAGITSSPILKHKIGSCGKLLPRMSIKVVDKKNCRNLEANKSGEIWIKGPLVAKGYINDSMATEAAFDLNGWFRTGDIGYYDEDGYIYIIGRLKELIKYQGYQIAPAEIEEILLKHPKICDAAVIGIPDETDGELPAAFVCKKKGEQVAENDIIKFLSTQISPLKQLHGGVYFIDKIPKTATGKILRRELRNLVECKLAEPQIIRFH